MTAAPAQRILLTGPSRGLGLGFVEQYLAQGHQVWALGRQLNPALESLAAAHADLHFVAADVSDRAQVDAALAEVADQTGALDLVINNAGIAGGTSAGLGKLDEEDLRRVFDVNVLGALRVTEASLGLLRGGREPRLVHITSRMGSMADNQSGGWWAYRISKAALNMACVNSVGELRAQGIATAVLHPGWVRTDMGGSAAPLDVATAVRGMRQVIADLDLSRSGGFWDYSGAELPW